MTAIDDDVRDLVKLIFDKTMMKEALKSMDIDLNKMPLGKISKRQIAKAYGLLSDIEKALQVCRIFVHLIV